MTTYPFTVEGLSSALAALGSTPAQVADTLLDGGHRGRPGCDATCPVAEYLTFLYPDTTCSVTEDPPDWLIAEVWTANRSVQTRLPLAVLTFVVDFDHGRYAELDRTVAVAL
jgi:hypothetical protein